MPSTESEYKMNNAEITVKCRVGNVTHTLTAHADASLTTIQEFLDIYDDYGIKDSYLDDTTCYLRLTPNSAGTYLNIKSEPDFIEIRTIRISIPALTAGNIEKARRQAGVSEDEPFTTEIINGEYYVMFVSSNANGDINE